MKLTTTITTLLAATAMAHAQSDSTRAGFRADVAYIVRTIAEDYAYPESPETWALVGERYLSQADTVTTRSGLVDLLERLLEELHDFHAHLTTNTARSAWLVPSGADLWAEWRGARAFIAAVRPGSRAERAGLDEGMEIVSVDGLAVRDAVAARLRGADTTPRALEWGLVAALAGNRDRRRTISARSEAGHTIDAEMASGPVDPRDVALLASRRLATGIGYIRIANSLGEYALIAAFDSALASLADADALVIDLRDTPGGGNSTVARGIMGRFVQTEMPYQKHSIPAEERLHGVRRNWLELVSPRPPIYRGRVVVLVDRWTGSMGEGIAIGMDAMKRATVVGTSMAGLLGATYHYSLPGSRFGVNLPVERLYHVDGRPREEYRPAVEVQLERSTDADPILDAALRLLR